MEKLHTLASERNGSTHAKPLWHEEGDDKGDGDWLFLMEFRYLVPPYAVSA